MKVVLCPINKIGEEIKQSTMDIRRFDYENKS